MKVLYFSHLKQITGLEEETLYTTSISQTLDHLKQKYSSLNLDHCLISLNCNIITPEYDGVLSDKDELVFIPPVSGG